MFPGSTRRHDYLGDGIGKKKKKKKTKHQRMLLQPKANQRWRKLKQRKCGRHRCKETMDTQRIKQSKKTGQGHKYINKYADVQYTHTTTAPRYTQSPESTSKPEAGRKSSPRQNTTGRLLAFFRPPPPEEHATKTHPNPPQKNHLGHPLPPKFRAQLLAWPDLCSCTDALQPVEDLQVLNGDG